MRAKLQRFIPPIHTHPTMREPIILKNRKNYVKKHTQKHTHTILAAKKIEGNWIIISIISRSSLREKKPIPLKVLIYEKKQKNIKNNQTLLVFWGVAFIIWTIWDVNSNIKYLLDCSSVHQWGLGVKSRLLRRVESRSDLLDLKCWVLTSLVKFSALHFTAFKLLRCEQ